jgi:ABC-2 type transport system permease protein
VKNIWIVAKKDLSSFFNSPVFYCLTTVFLVLNGFIFINILNFFSLQSFQVQQQRGASIGLNLNEMVIEPSFQNMAVILLLIIPLVTMRSFAEEKKSKTFALLLSSPIHLIEIILGKFMACMLVIGLMILLSVYSTGYLILVFEGPMSGCPTSIRYPVE